MGLPWSLARDMDDKPTAFRGLSMAHKRFGIKSNVDKRHLFNRFLGMLSSAGSSRPFADLVERGPEILGQRCFDGHRLIPARMRERDPLGVEC